MILCTVLFLIFTPHFSIGENQSGQLEKTGKGGYNVVCYYESWAVYRKSPGKFEVKDIDASRCTHLIYAFAELKNNKIASSDPELDIDDGAYKAAINLKSKNPALKVLISIGGWGDGGAKYSHMVSNKKKRSIFINSVVKFLNQHGFDGLDVDWEFPGDPERGGTPKDKKNFVRLIKELKKAFIKRKKNWILTAAVSANKKYIDRGYLARPLGKYLDLLNVMAYDFHGPWDSVVNPHSAIKDAEFAMNYWKKKGAPAKKLNLGIPFYGRTFTLKNPTKHTPGSPAAGAGKPGEFTKEKGYISFYEICQFYNKGGWTAERDNDMNAYMYKDDQWISFDEQNMIKKKVKFIKSKGFAGAKIWAIDLDDHGECNSNNELKWPLLNELVNNLNN